MLSCEQATLSWFVVWFFFFLVLVWLCSLFVVIVFYLGLVGFVCFLVANWIFLVLYNVLTRMLLFRNWIRVDLFALIYSGLQFSIYIFCIPHGVQ